MHHLKNIFNRMHKDLEEAIIHPFGLSVKKVNKKHIRILSKKKKKKHKKYAYLSTRE